VRRHVSNCFGAVEVETGIVAGYYTVIRWQPILRAVAAATGSEKKNTAAGSPSASGFGGGNLVTVLHPRSSSCRHALAAGAKLEDCDP
jgi:hypothetical protein